MGVSEEGSPGHPLSLQFRGRRLRFEPLPATGAMSRVICRGSARGCRLSVTHAMAEGIELVIALEEEVLHRLCDYLRHPGRLS